MTYNEPNSDRQKLNDFIMKWNDGWAYNNGLRHNSWQSKGRILVKDSGIGQLQKENYLYHCHSLRSTRFRQEDLEKQSTGRCKGTDIMDLDPAAGEGMIV